MPPLSLTIALILFLAQTAEPKKEAPKAEDPAVQVTFKDGLQLKTSDGAFEGRIGGWAVSHYRSVAARPDGSRTSADTFYSREIALVMEGSYAKQFLFKVEGNFAPSSAAMMDAWAAWSPENYPTLRFGNFKQPFSQEETTSVRFIDFVERAPLNRLVPARSLGFMIMGRILGGPNLEFSVHNGEASNTADANDEKDVAARLRYNPFESLGEKHPLSGLRLGVAGTFGDVDSSTIGAATDFFDLTTTELSARFLNSTGVGAIDGRRTRLGFELSWAYESFGARFEYVRRTDEVDIGLFTDEEVETSAWYLGVTWLLTGDRKTPEKRIVPLQPVDPAKGNGVGAFELAARVSVLEIGDEVFDLGIASAAGNADKVTTFTLGLNYWPARMFRISPNLVFEKYSDDVSFAAGRDEDSLVGALIRFQIDF